MVCAGRRPGLSVKADESLLSEFKSRASSRKARGHPVRPLSALLRFVWADAVGLSSDKREAAGSNPAARKGVAQQIEHLPAAPLVQTRPIVRAEGLGLSLRVAPTGGATCRNSLRPKGGEIPSRSLPARAILAWAEVRGLPFRTGELLVSNPAVRKDVA